MKFPQRIVCLTEEPTEVLYALGEEGRIAGISGFTVRPPRARREWANARNSCCSAVAGKTLEGFASPPGCQKSD